MEPKREYNMPFVPAYAVEGGTLLFLAGCGPIPLYHKHPHDPIEERQWMSGGFRAQYNRTIENIRLVLNARGGDLDNIVKLTVYLTVISMQGELNDAVFETFGRENPPPRTLVEVSALSHEDMLIEIDAIAAV
jgi:enamine deaminase RidA (YjgF/YER057c/UK114 family)